MLGKWRIFMASFVCVAGLLIFVGFQAVELGQAHEKVKDGLRETQARLDCLLVLQEQHPDLEAYEMEIESQRKYVDEMLPDKINTAILMPRLQQNALKYGLELRELLPGQVAKENGTKSLPLQIRLSGDYFGVLDFVKSLEKGVPFCQVTAMELEQKNNNLDAMLKVNVYSM